MSTRKVDLAALGDKVDLAPAAKPRPTEPKRRTTPATTMPARPKRQPVGERLRYDQYERKESRLTREQYQALTDLSRDLNRQRNGEGERITENTLIRIAIDLLLTHPDELHGTTEAELRKSVGL